MLPNCTRLSGAKVRLSTHKAERWKRRLNSTRLSGGK